MPEYTFRNKKTDEVFNKHMSYSELVGYMDSNPELVRVFKPLNLGYSYRTNGQTPDGFKDVIKNMKKGHPLNTISD